MEYVFLPTASSAAFWAVTLVWLAGSLATRCTGVRGDIAARRTGDAVTGGRPTLAAITIGALASLGVAGLAHHLEIGRFSGGLEAATRTLGLTLYAAGVALRLVAARALGGEFTRLVRTSRSAPLVGSGPYARLRHPLYLGLFLAIAGLAGSMANLPGWLAPFILLVPPLEWRRREEEAALARAHGRLYGEWAARRGIWWPSSGRRATRPIAAQARNSADASPNERASQPTPSDATR